MECSGPVLPLTFIDYDTLLRHSSPSQSSQHAAVPSRDSLGICLQLENDDGVMERSSSELIDGISVDNSLKSELESKNDGVMERSASEVNDGISVDNSINLDSELELAEEKDKNERNFLVAEVITALGPQGSGLLAIKGVPEVAALRKRLLPLAKKLALMGDAARRPVLKNYGLSTDVPLKRPDRPVSAFATKLQYSRHVHATDGSCLSLPFSKSSPGCLCDVSSSKDPSKNSQKSGSEHSDLQQLESIILQLGASMVEVGLLIARLCDSAIPGAHLEDTIWESRSVKARLIHYHASTEKDLMFYSAKKGNEFKVKGKSQKLSKIDKSQGFESTTESSSQSVQAGNSCTAAESINTLSEDLWQGWHYDYGILTVLTAPMFLSSSSLGANHSVPDCDSYPGGHSGLSILSKGECNVVSVSPDCLIVQVGETAQIASGGKLAAVAHCVCRPPTGQVGLSRETFVTFLQPAWDRVLNPPMGVTRAEVLNLEGFQKSRTSFLVLKEGKENVLEECRAESVYLRPHCSSEGEDCDGGVVAEVRNLQHMDKCTDLLSHPKDGKAYTKLTRTEISNVQGISSVKLGTPAPESSTDNLFFQKRSGRTNTLSEQHTKVSSVVPSLDSRWKEGFTFAEFSRETTAQYYGAQGRQSQRTGHASAG
ncbi:unnamed protein product [Calypogeia fissa]